MFDIDKLVFGTKKKSKPMPKLKTNGFTSFELLGGNSRHFILGDKVTPKQRVAIRKDPFGDWDKDGVINGLDCQPRNKKKHNAMFRQQLQNKYNIQLPNDEDRYMTNKYVHAFKRNPTVLPDATGVEFQGRDKFKNSEVGIRLRHEHSTTSNGITGGIFYMGANRDKIVLTKPITVNIYAQRMKGSSPEYVESQIKRDENEIIYHEIGHNKDKYNIAQNIDDMNKKQDEYMDYWNKMNHTNPEDIAEMKKKQQTLSAHANLRDFEQEFYAEQYAKAKIRESNSHRLSFIKKYPLEDDINDAPLPANFDKPMEENKNV